MSRSTILLFEPRAIVLPQFTHGVLGRQAATRSIRLLVRTRRDRRVPAPIERNDNGARGARDL